jgi:hypothetical protein
LGFEVIAVTFDTRCVKGLLQSMKGPDVQAEYEQHGLKSNRLEGNLRDSILDPELGISKY